MSQASLQQLQTRVEEYARYAEAVSSRSLKDYLDVVVIDAKPDPQPFRLLARSWQREHLGRIIPALEWACGMRPGYHGPLCFWRTLARGHDKSSSLARLSNGILAFTKKRLSIVVAAGDRDQAALIARFMKAESDLNPWLARRLDFKNYQVRGQHGSDLQIISADAYSSYGQTPDLLIADELCHWAKKDLWDTLLSARNKRNSVVVVITNAGILGSWQWDVMQTAKTLSLWDVLDPGKRFDTWMSEENLLQDRKLMTPGEARRVLDNVWLTPGEDSAYLTLTEVDQCFDLGRELGLARRERGREDTLYYAGLDYGPSRDRTCGSVVHKQGDNFVLDRMDIWQGSREQKVPITLVEAWADDVIRDFHRPTFVVDQYQMEGTIQKLQTRTRVERFEPRGGKSNYQLAQHLRGLVANRRLGLYEGAGDLYTSKGLSTLRDELADLVVRRTSYGFRLDTAPGKFDDRAVSLGMPLLQAAKTPELRPVMESDCFW